MLLSEAFNLYAKDVIAFRNQSRKTEEHHLVALKSLLSFMGDVDMSQVTFDAVRNWRLSMEQRNLTPETIRGYLVRLRVVLDYLRIVGEAALNPELIPLPKRVQKIPNFLSSEQVQELIDSTRSYKAKAIISMLYSSGIRVSELCSLDRNHLRPDGTFTVMGKGNKSRLCFVDARTLELISAYLRRRNDNNPALFISNINRTRLTPGNAQEIFKHIRHKNGYIETISPHWLRHSYATNLMQNGAHIYTVSRLLGHSSIATTQIYLHISDIRLQEEYNRFHSV